MKQLLNLYKGVGKYGQRFDTVQPGPWILNKKPFIDQTPGRLQYYKAENEPFIPDDIKWAIRMPTRNTLSTFRRDYLDQTRTIIHDHVQSHFTFDITNGGKLDIDQMTLGELKSIFEKQNQKIKEMYESGELEKFLKEYNDCEQQFNAG